MATVLAGPLLTPACTASNPRQNGEVVWQGPQTVLRQTLGQMATMLAAPLLTPACTAPNPRLNGKVCGRDPRLRCVKP